MNSKINQFSQILPRLTTNPNPNPTNFDIVNKFASSTGSKPKTIQNLQSIGHDQIIPTTPPNNNLFQGKSPICSPETDEQITPFNTPQTIVNGPTQIQEVIKPLHQSNTPTALTHHTTSDEFIKHIEKLFNSQTQPESENKKLLFRFEFTKEAALHNAIVLEQYNFDIKQAIISQSSSQVMFGSEFRKPTDLEPFLSEHPNWKELELILSHGADFPLTPITQEQRSIDNKFHKERGNHKSALRNKDTLDKIIQEDVERGFALPLPVELLSYIPNASLAPLGCQEQETINERGERIPKFRMTHDQTFPGPSLLSVNLRVIQDNLPMCMYSYVLMRTLHYIVHLRHRHPTTKIFISKYDIDAAYRRCHLSGKTAAECLTIHNNILLMALRMTFGGSPCPSLWGIISETIADICNTLLNCKQWDHKSLYDNITNSIRHSSPLPESIPFHKAKELSVKIPINDTGKVDIYIDDTIAITPDLPGRVERMNAAVPLAIRILSRPLNETDEIPRKDIISLKKFQAEACPEEIKTVLGWTINTRSLSISLPTEKFLKWSNEIESLINSKKVSSKQLESTLGRINHFANILSIIRHFLGRIRQALWRASKHKWTTLKLCEKTDLHLILKFMVEANQGISINNLVFRKPTIILRSDASEFGIGGYNILSGRAWRLELPVDCRLRTSLNSLEFIACVISIWIESIMNSIPDESCILSQTDSSSATGWLRKSNFSDLEDEVVQMTTARHLAYTMLSCKSCLYSQWFPGDENQVSDSLSRDFQLNNEELTHLITTFLPEQVPFGFHLCPLPEEIVSWLTLLLRNQPFKEQWSKQPTRSKLSRGLDTKLISNPLASSKTGTWTTLPNTKNTKYSAPLVQQSEMVDFLNKTNLINQDQLDPPSIMWHRPTSWLIDQTQDWTQMGNLHSFYNAKSEVTKTQTTQKHNK